MCWITGNGGTRSLRDLAAGMLLACAILFAAPVDEVSAAAQSDFPTITIYHDQSGPARSVDRYNKAVELLKEVNRAYVVRNVTGTAKVEQLAGVSGTVMPRFFLGDPEEQDWGPPQSKVNNGGLRWLRSLFPAATVVSGITRVKEGGPAIFNVKLSSAAPVGGLTINLLVTDAENSNFVTEANEGDKTRLIPEGSRSKLYVVSTFDDWDDEPDGNVTVTLTSGTGYVLGKPKSASVPVRDDEAPGERGLQSDQPTIVIYHDLHHSFEATERYISGRRLLNTAERPYIMRFVTGNAKIDTLSGVSDSDIPRFFLGDPEEQDWGPSEPGVNNGGLTWLRSVLSASKPAAGDQVLSVVAGPNPFNPSTTIRVQLPVGGPVSLTIYNMAGQIVRTLWDGQQVEAGDYTIDWDSRDQQGQPVSSGVYLYVLRTHEQVLKHKMVLIR